jgi:hypothetical protein
MERKHNHAEAFSLMKYQDSVTGKVEVVWNSRDGVTPFVIFSPEGNESRHVSWSADRYEPGHVPQVGDRIFVDLTMERCRKIYREWIEKEWDSTRKESPRFKERYASKEDAIEKLATTMFDDGKQPDIIEVTEEIRQRFLTKSG